MAFNTYFWPILGFVFLPWTTLLYALAYPIVGLNWLWIVLGLVADIATYAAAASRRQDVAYYAGP